MVVQDCYIHNTATTGVYAKGGSRSPLIERNLICDCGNCGIMLGEGADDMFYEAANKEMYETYDGIARNNIIMRTKDAGIAVWASYKPQVCNNTVIDACQSGMAALHVISMGHSSAVTGNKPVVAHTVDAIIKNNIFILAAKSPRPMIHISKDATAGNFTLAGNRYFKAGGGEAKFWDERDSQFHEFTMAQWLKHMNEIGSSEGDPKLDANGHLLDGSPCIDAGAKIAGFSDDYDHNERTGTWDIGADEKTSGPPAAKEGWGAKLPAFEKGSTSAVAAAPTAPASAAKVEPAKPAVPIPPVVKIEKPVIKPEAIAAWNQKLIDRAIAAVGENIKPDVFLSVFGKEEKVKFGGADAKSLTVEIQKNPMPVSWTKLSSRDRANLAIALCQNGRAADHLLAGVLALIDGRDEAADDQFSKAAAADGGAALVAQARESLK
jgi:hypothetical protein